MTAPEIVTALRRAAVVCIEQGRSDWFTIDICRADGAFQAAEECADESWAAGDNPWHSATFLLFAAEAME